MENDAWKKVKQIFNSALDLGPDARAAFLNAECDGNDDVRRQVEELLASYQTGFLETTVEAPNAGVDNERHSFRLKPGQAIGHYEVIELIGSGGMGEVYLARDENLARLACIKVFSSETVTGRAHLGRFVREAQSASALNNPHICTVYEINKENDPPFIAMEYVEGKTLSEMIASGKLDPQTAIDIALQTADGLADAHDAGIVHRDIKPANIIVNSRAQVKIVDFGLAKKFISNAEDQTQKVLTHSGMIIGTISYMSPEQARGKVIDARTDVWSLGVVLSEMLTGKHPFAGETTGDLIASILRSEPTFADAGLLSPELELLLKTSLNKDKECRYASARELARELENVKRSLSNTGNKVLQNETTAILPNGNDGDESLSIVSANMSSAYDLYMRGKVKICSENHEEVESAIKLLEEAVGLDRNFAEAYAVLAQAYTAKAFQFASDAEKKQLLEDAEVAVEKALALNPDLAEGHFARGVVLWTHAKRFPHEQAIQAYKRAISLNPNLDEAHHRLGLVYFHIGLLNEAREEVKKALEINPNNTMARFRMGTLDAHQGKYEDALFIFKTIPREVSPSIVDRATADALVHLGRLEEATALVADYLKKYPKDQGGNVTSVKAIISAKTGYSEDADLMINRAVEIGRGYGHFHHTACNLASAYAILNKPDEAVKWLRDAANDGFPCYPYFELDQNLNNIRNDPGFIGFMSEIKCAYERRVTELFPNNRTVSRIRDTWSGTNDSSAVSKFNRLSVVAILVVLLITGLGILAWQFFGRAPAIAIDSVAVMPLLNQTEDPDSEYLSDGITESLIGRLSQIPNLSVKARSSVFPFKGKDVAIRDIAKELSVPAILTGRLARRENSYSLYIELVDGATEKIVWQAQYDRPESSLATIPGEIARDVATNLRQKLTGEEQQKISQNYTKNSSAYALYLKGRYYWDKRNEESYDVAEDAYKRAIELDPKYALAYSGLADLYLFRDDKLSRDIAMQFAKQNALKALELDETLAEAHNTLAMVNENYDLDMPAAEAGFKRAIELKPNYAIAHQWYSGLLMWTGRTEEAVAEAKLAVDLEPYSAAVNWGYGVILLYAGRYSEAVDQEQKTLRILPDYTLAETTLADVYTLTHKYPEALVLLNKLTLNPERRGENLAKIARVYALTGKRTEAQKILSQIFADEAMMRRVGGYRIAWVYAALGNRDKAFRWLKKGYEDRVFHLMFLRADPFFENLHGDPRFDELVRRIGLFI